MFESRQKRLVMIAIVCFIIISIVVVLWAGLLFNNDTSPHNNSPIAYAGENITIKTNQLLYLNGNQSNDGDGTIVNYTWEFSDGYVGYGNNVTRFFPDNGNYSVTLTVMDNDGAYGTDEIETYVNNVAPSGKPEIKQFLHQYIRPPSFFRDYAISPPYHIRTNYSSELKIDTYDVLYLNASNSFDTDGEISNYTWNFDDGGIGYGIETKHRFFDDGIHIISLTIIDDDGAYSKENISVNIANRPPFAFIGDDKIVNKNDNITLNASCPLPLFSQEGSYDPDGRIVNYTWDFGDDNISFGEEVTHKYLKNGTYQINLTISDNDGLNSSDIALIIVSNVPPIANTEQYVIGNITEPVAFNGYGYDEDGIIVSFEWDFDGDGIFDWNSTIDANTTFVYDAMGVYLVQLKVIDNDGAIDITTMKVCIGNGSSFPPIALVDISYIDPNDDTKLYFDKIFCNASRSINIDNDNLTFYWNFGDNETGYGNIINHSYPYTNQDQWIISNLWGYHQRIYTIKLIVNDGEFTDEEEFDIIIYTYTGPWIDDHTMLFIDGNP